jgi:UDP-N-acetylmuramate-alanine ligase
MAGVIQSFAKDGDVLLCMGAGSIGAVCGQVLKLVESEK